MKSFVTTLLLLFTITGTRAQLKTYPDKITVSQDGSADYTTIQEAINSVRDLGHQRVIIYIKKGVYKEKVVIPSWKSNLSLVGENPENTVISWNDYSGKLNAKGKDALGLEKFSTFNSYTLLIQGNDIHIENLTIENTAGRVGQAVALHTEGDRIIITNCKITGNQDTLYTAKETSRQYFRNCHIEGTTDFIFGEATVVFERCTIKSLSNSYITAAATRPGQAFGYVFLDCKLIADSAATKVFLGRPWRPYAQTVFIRTEMGDHIVPEGWNPWKGDKMFPDKEKTAFYAEYANTGAGADTSKRVSWSRQLTKKQVEKYTIQNIFSGSKPWVPATK
ncbi:pectinesterase family protein [Desertivirga xinjiangensis]|uniref:pectinesterase family protein n=1 Tax=Desertivirga xinjiangensis TaxID=539206 RepID=UPI0021097A0C